jgi:hypothetical protein
LHECHENLVIVFLQQWITVDIKRSYEFFSRSFHSCAVAVADKVIASTNFKKSKTPLRMKSDFAHIFTVMISSDIAELHASHGNFFGVHRDLIQYCPKLYKIMVFTFHNLFSKRYLQFGDTNQEAANVSVPLYVLGILLDWGFVVPKFELAEMKSCFERCWSNNLPKSPIDKFPWTDHFPKFHISPKVCMEIPSDSATDGETAGDYTPSYLLLLSF